jgi:HEXXH motif-containing protein
VRLVPEGDDAILRARLAARSRRRLARVLSRWPQARRVRGIGSAVLASGVFRTWLASVEDALDVRDLAKAGRWSRLLDRIADLGQLSALAPAGSLPRDFPRRAEALASRELEHLARSAPRMLRVAEADASDDELVRTGGTGIDRAAVLRFAARVPVALALLRSAWPDAARMVLARTHAVVPIDDPGVVSYSSAREPGIAYVHVRSWPAVRLAEDLLHEATHMRVHEIESLHPLVRPSEVRFYSPWRREWRPLRGLLHGACTFTVGAGFFERMLVSPEVRFSPSRRVWLARRFLEEMESTRVALRTLASRRARGLLTRGGRDLVAAVRRERAMLVPAARAARARLTPREIRSNEAFRAALAARPFRSEVHRLGSR